MRAFHLSLLILASCASPDPAAPVSRFETPISMAVIRAEAREVFTEIAQKSGLNIIMPMEIPGTVTLSVNKVAAGEVLDAVAATFRLKVTRMKNDMARVHAP